MQISWTRLPFRAYNDDEFNRNLTEWLSHLFYEELPAKGYEIREEQIFIAFRIARALTKGTVLMAEAGPGTGKTFAYLLPAVCYARYKGQPVVVASATDVLQAQLANPEGDIQTLSRLLNLNIDARAALEPTGLICEQKVSHADLIAVERKRPKGWAEFRRWAETTGTGLRTEVPHVPDELWEDLAWDPGLSCDTCKRRGHCHVMTARRHYREAPDLIVTSHRLFCTDLLSRADLLEAGRAPMLPPYAAAVFDEGHRLSETWQRSQGHLLRESQFLANLERASGFLTREHAERLAERVRHSSLRFFASLAEHTLPGEGKQAVMRSDELLSLSQELSTRLEALEEELVTEEAMHEGLDIEVTLQAYQARLDQMRAALEMLGSSEIIVWAEGEDVSIVPRHPMSLIGPGRMTGTAPAGAGPAAPKKAIPAIFSSATLEPAYQARVLRLPQFAEARAGVPFDLGEQTLLFLPEMEPDPLALTAELIKAAGGRTLVLLDSLAEVQRYKEALTQAELPWTLLFEGDGDRSAQLERFRHEVSSVLVGATFWEGVDVPGESLSCCIIPRLPFPAHDPLIAERREQAAADGLDPFATVDLPEMLIKLKQGAGRLIRTAQDRGVLALLDRSHIGKPWEDDLWGALPEDAERTAAAERMTAFLSHQAKE